MFIILSSLLFIFLIIDVLLSKPGLNHFHLQLMKYAMDYHVRALWWMSWNRMSRYFGLFLQRLRLSHNTFVRSLKPKFSEGGKKKTLEVTTYKAFLDVLIMVCVFDCIYIETFLWNSIIFAFKHPHKKPL